MSIVPPRGYKRIQEHHLPAIPTQCMKTTCVYAVDGICDEPRINKGNGDAECHRLSNKRVLQILTDLVYEVPDNAAAGVDVQKICDVPWNI